MTIIDLAAKKLERSPHMTGPAQCLSCKHEWTAVAPVGTVALDCPACGGHKGQFEYLVDAPEDSAFFQCHCGNSLYRHIRRPDGQTHWMCVGCGIIPDV